MTPFEIFRIAKARSEKEAEQFKRAIAAAWTNAKLQRAKNIPKLEKLINSGRKPSFREVVDRIRSAPSA